MTININSTTPVSIFDTPPRMQPHEIEVQPSEWQAPVNAPEIVGTDEISDGSSFLPLGDTIEGTDASERISGLAGSDRIDAKSGHDRVYGGEGHDTIEGGRGNDWLYGKDGNDKLIGGSGNDRLFGGQGVDMLTGGTGRDTLSGGAGNDVFSYSSSDDSAAFPGGRDLITDFTAGADKIDLTALRAELGGEATSFEYVEYDASKRLTAGQVTSHFDAQVGKTLVEIGMDAASGADMQIELTGNLQLGQNDFILQDQIPH